MSGNICLAQNCLLLNESTRQMWIAFDRHLAGLDCRLVLLSTAAAESPLPFPVIPIPFLLRDYAGQYPGAAEGGGSVCSSDWEMLRSDSYRANRAYAPGEALRGMFTCRKLFAAILETLQPGYVLAFDPTCPLAQILQSLAVEKGLPVQYIERGLLPETLMIESRGIQAWSDARTHWLAQDLAGTGNDPDAYERIQSYYLTRKPQKYTQADFAGGGLDMRRQLGLENKKIVVFLGGGWEADGHASAATYERQFFTGFPTTFDALMALGRSVKRMPGVALVFKPHPLDTQSYVVAKLDGTRIVSDVNVHALIEAADVVVAQFTTLQFEAALYEKPIVLLARSAWWGRQACYEVESPEELPGKLEAALQRRDWPLRQARTRAFITWMMDQFLIGCTETVPVRRKLREFAGFIAGTAMNPRGLPSPEARWERAEQVMALLRAPAPVSSGKTNNSLNVNPHARVGSPPPKHLASVAPLSHE